MGIETVLLIVNEKSLDEILDMPWNGVYESMEKAKLTTSQTQTTHPTRIFSILTVRQKYLTGWRQLALWMALLEMFY